MILAHFPWTSGDENTNNTCKVSEKKSYVIWYNEAEPKCPFRNNKVCDFQYNSITRAICNTVKPVCNDHLYNKIYYLLFIQ